MNDPALIAEASQHFWVEFQQGGAFKPADPAFRTAELGQTFTEAAGQFAAVPDNLRHKVVVRLKSENSANTFNTVDTSPQTRLEQTFTPAELVGKPLSIGHFVDTQVSGGFFWSGLVRTYSPYLLIGQNDGDISDDPLIRGTDYQEQASSLFTWGNSALTGVFLEVDLVQPGGQTKTFAQPLADRLGYVVRQYNQVSSIINLGQFTVDFDFTQSLVSPADVTTLNIESSWYDSTLDDNRINNAERLKAEIETLSNQLQGADPANLTPQQKTLAGRLNILTVSYQILLTEAVNTGFSELSKFVNKNLAATGLVKVYFESPRITTVAIRSPQQEGDGTKLTMDLTHNPVRAIAYPKQWIGARFNFHIARGFAESTLEDAVMASLFQSDSLENSYIQQSSVTRIFQEAKNQGVDFAVISNNNLDMINQLGISIEAKIRISQSVTNGNSVVVPRKMIQVAEKETIGWFEIDPITGTVVDTNENGKHQANVEYKPTLGNAAYWIGVGYLSGGAIGIVLPKSTKASLDKIWDAVEANIAVVIILVGIAVKSGSQIAAEVSFFGAGFVAGLITVVKLRGDPPLPPMLIGLAPNDPVPPNSQPGVNVSVVEETVFTLPVNSAQLTSLYRLHIQNTGPAAATYQVAFPNPPAGFTAKYSLSEVTVPAGETGVVGVMLVPNNGLPAPATTAPVGVTVTDTTNNLSGNAQQTFTTPDVVGVALEVAPAQSITAAGQSSTAILTVKSTGNVAAANIPLTLQTPNGLNVGGVPETVSLGLNETKTFPLTASAFGDPNDTFTATITASFGRNLDGDPYQSTATLEVIIASPTAQAALRGAQAAAEANRPYLAATLNQLGIALNLLDQEPDNAAYRGRALALLDSLIGQLNGAALTPLIADLTAARTALANAAPTALTDLQNQLDRLKTTLTSDEGLLPFELALWPASAMGQPDTGARFYVKLRNIGEQTASYNLRLGPLPDDVNGSLSRDTITLEPGESTSVDQGQELYVTLTPSTQAIQTVEFTVTADLVGSNQSRSAQGILLARPETLQITNVKVTPGFTDPGGTVQISADIISAVNQTRSLSVSCRLMNASGIGGVCSPRLFTAEVAGTLTSVDFDPVRIFDSAPKGVYTVEVEVYDLQSYRTLDTAQATLLVGSPLTASLNLNPQVVPPGAATTQASLSLVGQNVTMAQLQLLSQTDTKATAKSLAVQGNYAYVCGDEDITLFDISDPRNPLIVKTIADDLINGSNTIICRIIDNHLIVTGQIDQNAPGMQVLVFDLADPTAPALVSEIDLPYRFTRGWYSKGRTVFAPFGTLSTTFGTQKGDFAAFDYSDFNNPTLIGALYGFQGLDGGGKDMISSAVPANDRYALLGTGDTNGLTDSARGRVLTVDTSDPAQMTVAHETTVPGTRYVINMILVGDVLWVLGTKSIFGISFAGYYYDLTLSAFDVTNPLDLQLLNSVPITGYIGEQGIRPYARGLRNFQVSISSLGNGSIAISGLEGNDKPLLTVVDVNDPLNPHFNTLEVTALLYEMQRQGNILFAPSNAGLGLYRIGEPLSLNYAAQVQIPRNTGVSVVADSFNIPPTRIETAGDHDTLVWERALDDNRPQETLTWQLQATDLAPAEIRPVTGDTVIDFTTSAGDPGQVTLRPADLIARQIVALAPTSRTVKPGETAGYTVSIENPSDQPVTYTLSVQGVPGGWAQLASPVTVPARGSQNVPLNLVTTATSILQYGFMVTAVANTGFTANLLGTLILQQEGGSGPPPDLGPDVKNPARGVAITLTPAVATAATFIARLVNLGDETATFDLAGAFPAGFTAELATTRITLPPGMNNYRDVRLTLTPPTTTNPADYAFTVAATAVGAPSVSNQATGTVRVVNLGVDVDLAPEVASPPATLSLKVTNTGRVQENFKLELAGPGALYTPLPAPRVTLAAGASQTLTLNVDAITTALPGDLSLIAIATAQSNESVRDSDTTLLGIAASRGLEVVFDPDSQTLPAPGPATFLLQVQNTGNREEAYQAVITTASGPVSAALEGLDGQPTQRIATFRLPALATGLLTLDTTLQQAGTGQVTVTVNTLDAPALTGADTATVTTQDQPPPPTNQPPIANAGPDRSIPIGQAATVDGRASRDPDNGPAALQFTWTVVSAPSGSTVTTATLQNANTAQARFTPDVAGQYRLRLTVSDGALSVTDDVVLTAASTPPPPPPAPGDPAAIPTLNEWMQILMALLMLLALAWVTRQRRHL